MGIHAILYLREMT